MAIVTTITECQANTGLVCLNNGTSSISVQENFPTFDATFPTDYLVDLLITSMNGFISGETIEVLVDSVSLGTFSIGTTPEKTIWLSELIGMTSREVLSSKPITQNVELKFLSNKLLSFILVSAKASDYVSAITTYNNILTISNNYVLAKTEIQDKDENSLSALRSCIDGTKATIKENGTNVITIENVYPTPFGTALDKTLVQDVLITFNKRLNIGTQIYIKKDGNHINTYTTKSNLKYIWLSELLNASSKEFLYNKVSELYELTFVYDTQINCQIIAGQLTDFPSASVAGMTLTQNLFELANAKALDNIPIETNDCLFTINYDSYNNSIKDAKLKINEQQEVDLSFVTDNSGTTTKNLIKLSNIDNLYNVSIDLVMDSTAIKDYITIMRDFGRKLNELNSASTTSK